MHAPRRIHHSLDVGTVALRIIVLVAALAIAARIYGAGRCNCNPTKTVGDPGVPVRLGALGASCLHTTSLPWHLRSPGISDSSQRLLYVLVGIIIDTIPTESVVTFTSDPKQRTQAFISAGWARTQHTPSRNASSIMPKALIGLLFTLL